MRTPTPPGAPAGTRKRHYITSAPSSYPLLPPFPPSFPPSFPRSLPPRRRGAGTQRGWGLGGRLTPSPSTGEGWGEGVLSLLPSREKVRACPEVAEGMRGRLPPSPPSPSGVGAGFKPALPPLPHTPAPPLRSPRPPAVPVQPAPAKPAPDHDPGAGGAVGASLDSPAHPCYAPSMRPARRTPSRPHTGPTDLVTFVSHPATSRSHPVEPTSRPVTIGHTFPKPNVTRRDAQ